MIEDGVQEPIFYSGEEIASLRNELEKSRLRIKAMLDVAEGNRSLRHQKNEIIGRQAAEIEDLKRQVRKLGG